MLMQRMALMVMMGVLAIGAGCERAPEDDAPEANAPEVDAPEPLADDEELADDVWLLTEDGRYRVRYETEPAPLPLNELFHMGVIVQKKNDDGEWQPATDIALNVDGVMPAHHHGMNVMPKVIETGAGEYEVRGMLFHMIGLWELHFDITEDGVTHRVAVEVMLE